MKHADAHHGGARGVARVLLVVWCALAVALFAAGCMGAPSQTEGQPEESQPEEEQIDPLRDLVEDEFGIATDTMGGTYSSVVSRSPGHASLESTTFTLNEGSSAGAVFWGTYEADGSERAVCVYVDEGGYQGLGLYASTYSNGVFSDPYLLAPAHAACRWYVGLKGSVLTVVECYDDIEGWYDGYLYLSRSDEMIAADATGRSFTESVRVMDLREGFVDALSITRVLDSGMTQTRDCEIVKGDAIFKYVAGYDSYTNGTSVTMLSTEQEFCDQANAMLRAEGVDWLTLGGTSWDSRWLGLDVDESGIPDTMARVDVELAVREQVGEYEVDGTFSVSLNAGAEPAEEGASKAAGDSAGISGENA